MKLLKSYFLSVLLISSSSCLFAITDQNQRELEVLNKMTASIGTGDVRQFLKDAQTAGWVAPPIYSAWYVARRPEDPEGNKQVLLAENQFGLAFAKALTTSASKVIEFTASEELEYLANSMFDSMTWLGSKHYYGNLLLESRAYDIASVAAIKLVANLDYPFDSAAKLVARFNLSWESVPIRQDVLFGESDGLHFKHLDSSPTVDELKKEWQTLLQAAQDQHFLENHPDLSLFTLPEFGVGERVAKPESTWNRKLHFKLVEGLDSVNAQNLHSLYEFRRRYGRFPNKPTSYHKAAGESDIQAAFWELSWKNPEGVGSAYIVYSQYLEGRLKPEGESGTN